MRISVLSALAFCSATALHAQALHYPTAPRGDVVDNYFGTAVPDPYRGLEDLDASATTAWVGAENSLTYGYLAALPQRDVIRERLTTLWNYPRVSAPAREANQLWYRRNSGLQKQSVLYRQPTLTARPVAVLDPNLLSPDGSVAVLQWSVSPDGRMLGYTTSTGGSDLQDIHLRSIATGRDLPEVVPNVKFSGISWTRDSKGFFFAKFRGSGNQANLRDANTHHQLFYHTLGSEANRLVFERTDDSTAWVGAGVSDDGRWLFVSSSGGTTNTRVWLADLKDPLHPDLAAPFMPVTTAEDAINYPVGVVGDTLYLYTTWQAPKGRIVAVAVGDSSRANWRTVIPEGPDAMAEMLLVGRRLIVTHMVDVQTRMRLYDLSGKPQGEVTLPEPGASEGLSGRTDGTDFFFTLRTYLRPATVYRYDLRTARLEPFQPPRTLFDASPYETRASFYRSKDGTRVPIFITARKGVARDGSHPTLLYAYGGFGASLTAFYSPATAVWLEHGGVYAVANLRGGGEYGEDWHQAGTHEKKQNVFDDFVAAGEYLLNEGYASPRTLAIQGASNGGLLVGAAMTQRPDLFGVALPGVGVMDMLRYQKFTGGQLWAEEYGSSDDSAAVGYLAAYSPLHNIKPGVCYPATLVTTADHDDRVVPAHSFKFAATLQAEQACAKPVLLRVEITGSHGYRPLDRVIMEIADELSFALANLGTPVP